MKQVQKAGGIVVNSRGEILIITNIQDRKTFPKGTPEAGEQPIDTARREIQEESGLQEFMIHLEIGIIVRPGFTEDKTNAPSVIKQIRMFFCTTEELDLKPNAPDIQSAQWVKPGKVIETLSWREEADFFAQQRDKLKL